MAEVATGPLIQSIHVRVHRDELVLLTAIAQQNRLPIGTVVRGMMRHFLDRFEKGEPPPPELGAIRWEAKSAAAGLGQIVQENKIG